MTGPVRWVRVPPRHLPVCLRRSAEVDAVDMKDGAQLGPALLTLHFLSPTVGRRDRLGRRCVTFSVHLSRHASVDSLLHAGVDVGPPAPNSRPLLAGFHVQLFPEFLQIRETQDWSEFVMVSGLGLGFGGGGSDATHAALSSPLRHLTATHLRHFCYRTTTNLPPSPGNSQLTNHAAAGGRGH